MGDVNDLEKVVERFMRRKEIRQMGLTKEEVRETLIKHAQKWSGCIACKYSAPGQGSFSWTRRHCTLGLAQGTCGMFVPFLKEKGGKEFRR